MTVGRLSNDLETIKNSMLEALFVLQASMVGVTDPAERTRIATEIDNLMAEIGRLMDKMIDDGVDGMLNDAAFQADLVVIRKGAKDAKVDAAMVKKATDKVKAVSKLIAKAVKPIERLLKYVL